MSMRKFNANEKLRYGRDAIGSSHQGLHFQRTSCVLRERLFTEEWQKRQGGGNWLLTSLLGEKHSHRDAEVAATIVQWLGSNVGQEFLHSVNCEIKEATKNII